MRKISTSLKAPRLLRIACFSLLLFPFALLAQTTHTVYVGPGLVYDPAELTITAGDQVDWISLGGYHDVNFDENSVNGNSFGNPISIAEASLPPQGEGTMGSITFPEAGTYDYDCSVGSHALGGMVGKVIVNPAPNENAHTVYVGPGLTYDPAELTITAGDVVTWISLGGTHDVNFDVNTVTGASFGNPTSIADASLPTQGAGTMGSIAFPDAGTYDYDCSVGAHAQFGMVGKVIVNAAPSSTLSAADEILELFEPWNTSITLANGWNMFGYGCPEPDDVAEALSAHTDKIIIVKNSEGKAYLTEFGFNGIGDFLPGQGYQIKLTETIEGFSFCDAYIEDIPAKLNEILNAD